MEKSKGNWDFDAASSPQSNDALERLCIRGRPLLCAEAGGACERFLPKLAARACCSLNSHPCDATLPATKERDASASSAASGGTAGQDVGASQRPAKLPSTSGGLGRDGGGGEAR